MGDISKEKLRDEIAEILKDANLAEMSAKKVRLELEKKLDVELMSRKKEIDALVMDYVNNQPSPEPEEEKSESEEESEDESPKKKRKTRGSVEEKPKKAAAKKAKKKKGSNTEQDQEWDKKKKKKSGGGKGSGYTRAHRLSEPLAELMGQDTMARHEVVKKVWAIIKERNLYDQNNKQFAICDDSLYKVFGCKRFRTFGMMKYLKTHFYD